MSSGNKKKIWLTCLNDGNGNQNDVKVFCHAASEKTQRSQNVYKIICD